MIAQTLAAEMEISHTETLLKRLQLPFSTALIILRVISSGCGTTIDPKP